MSLKLHASGSSLASVSRPSIVAGAAAACAMALVLLAFGTGLGLSMVSPWTGSGVSANTYRQDLLFDRRLPRWTAAVRMGRRARRRSLSPRHGARFCCLGAGFRTGRRRARQSETSLIGGT
jgi:hypothetical protein